MLEGSIMESGKMYISMVLILFMLAMAIFIFQVQQSNHYKQYVNYQIERNGGLTADVIANINTYSDQHFNGVFKLDDSQVTGKQPFGTVIEYRASSSLRILFFEFDSIMLPITGSATSMLR